MASCGRLSIGLPEAWGSAQQAGYQPAAGCQPAPQSSRAATNPEIETLRRVFFARAGRLKIGRRLQTCPTFRRKLSLYSASLNSYVYELPVSAGCSRGTRRVATLAS